MARTRKCDPDQLLLLWDADRAERRTMIRAIPNTRTGLTRATWRNCQEVLCFLVCGYRPEGIFPSQLRIAEWTNLGESTVQRAIRILKHLGVIRTRRRGSTSCEYFVDLAALARLGIEEPHQTDGAEPSDRRVRPIRVTGQNRQSDGTPRLQEESAECQPESHSTSTDWSEVADQLFALGVNQAAAAVACLRSNGAEPADVAPLVEHWLANREGWQPHEHAILFRRLQRWQPGQAIDEGWPPATAEHARRVAVEQAALASDRQRRAREVDNASIGPRDTTSIGEWLRQRGVVVGGTGDE